MLPRLHLVNVENRAGSASRYLTLSHCWGKTHRLTLTADTFAELSRGVSLLKLPKTFVDAIKITCRLGVPYLWIDCLCIFQDSIENWAPESSIMADIYAHTRCKIAAAASSDSHGGCFVERNPLEVQPLRFEYNPFVPKARDSPAQPTCIFREPVSHTWYQVHGPLDQRA